MITDEKLLKFYPEQIYECMLSINGAVYPTIQDKKTLEQIASCCNRAVIYNYDTDPAKRGADLIYNIIKNHYLADANKRTAFLMFRLYLIKLGLDHTAADYINNHIGIHRFVDEIVDVAGSDVGYKDIIIRDLTRMIKGIFKHCDRIKELSVEWNKE